MGKSFNNNDPLGILQEPVKATASTKNISDPLGILQDTEKKKGGQSATGTPGISQSKSQLESIYGKLNSYDASTEDLSSLYSLDKNTFIGASRLFLPDVPDDFRTSGEAISALSKEFQKAKGRQGEVGQFMQNVKLGRTNSGEVTKMLSYPETKDFATTFVKDNVPRGTDDYDFSGEMLDEAVKQNAIKNIPNYNAEVEKQVQAAAQTLLEAQKSFKVKTTDNPLKSGRYSFQGEQTPVIIEGFPQVDFSSPASIGAAIERLKKRDELVDKDGKRAAYQIADAIGDLEYVYRSLKIKEKPAPEIVQNEEKIRFGIKDILNDRPTEVKEIDEDNAYGHFVVGLNYIKDFDPAKYKNVLTAIKTSRKSEKISDNDFASISQIGQSLANEMNLRAVSSVPEAYGKETKFNYNKANYQLRKSELARKIGEANAGNSGDLSIDEIRKLAAKVGGEDGMNEEMIKDLAYDERKLFRSAIPGSSGAERFATGLVAPVNRVINTLSNIGKSDAEKYLQSQKLDVTSGEVTQQVFDEKGRASGVLPSDRGNVWHTMLQGLGEFVPQVLLAKGIGGAGAGIVNEGRVLAGAGELSAAARSGIGTYSGTYVSTYLQEFDSAYKQALNATGDGNKATLLANINANAAAAFELLLPDVKIGDKAMGLLKGKYLDDITKLTTESIENLPKAGRSFAERFIKDVVSTTGQEISEGVGTQLVDYLSYAIVAPESVKDRDLGNELIETAKQTALQMALPAVLGAGGANIKRGDFTRQSLDDAALNIDEYKKVLEKRVTDGYMNEDEKNSIVKIVSTHRESLHNAPTENSNGAKLSIEQINEYAYQNTIEKINKEKLANPNIDDIQKEDFQNKIKSIQDKKREIFIPKEPEVVEPVDYGLTKEVQKEATDFVNELLSEDVIQGITKEAAKKDPIGFLKTIADQSQNINSTGEQNKTDSPEQATRDQYGDTLVDYANELFPNKNKQNENEAETKAETQEGDGLLSQSATGSAVADLSIQPEGNDVGRTVVTISGLTEAERQAKIEMAKSQTKLSEKEVRAKEIIKDINSYNILNKGISGKLSPVGLLLINKIRNEASEIGYTFDDRSGKLISDTGKPLRQNYLETRDRSIDEKGVVIRDRSQPLQEAFSQMFEAGIFPNGYRLNGNRMSEAEIGATVGDIIDGIPSERASNYLNQLEEYVSKGLYEVGGAEIQKIGVSLNDLLGVQAESIGEPMTEELLNSWLNDDANLSSEVNELLDNNFETLIDFYEAEQERTGIDNLVGEQVDIVAITKLISKTLNIDNQRATQINDIALKAKDYEDFKKQVYELIGDDTVNENRIAETYDDVRKEAKSEYEKQLEKKLEDLRAAYTDATLADAALKRMNEQSPKSIRGFIKRLLTGATPETVAANKGRLVEMQRQYRKEKADMRAMLPRERGANFIVEKLSRAARNGEISQEAADLAIDLLRKQPEMFGDLAISITGKKGENGRVEGWYRAADALVKLFKNPSDPTTAVHELLHHTERFLPHEIRDKIIGEWNNEVNLQIADIQKKLKTETNADTRQQLTQGLLFLGLAQERQLEPNRDNVKSMERIMSKYLGGHTDSKGNFHKGLGNSWYQLYNPSEWWAVNASSLFRDAKNKPELKTWTDKAKAFYNYIIDSVKKIFKGSPTAAVEKGLKAVLNGDVLEDREGTQLSASNKLLNIKQKDSFEDRLKFIYDEIQKERTDRQVQEPKPRNEAEDGSGAEQNTSEEGGSGTGGEKVGVENNGITDEFLSQATLDALSLGRNEDDIFSNQNLSDNQKSVVNSVVQKFNDAKKSVSDLIKSIRKATPDGKAISDTAITLMPYILKDKSLQNEIKDQFYTYQPDTFEDAKKYAKDIIQALGSDGAMQILESQSSFENNIPIIHRLAVYSELAIKFKSENKTSQEANALMAIRRIGTESAKGLSGIQLVKKILGLSSGDAKIEYYNKLVDEINEGLLSQYGTEISEMTQEISNLKNDLKKAVLENKKLSDNLATIIANSANNKQSHTTKEKAKNLADKLRKTSDKIRKGLSGLNFSVGVPVSPTIIADAVDFVANIVEQGGNIIDAIQKGIDFIKGKDNNFKDDDKFRELILKFSYPKQYEQQTEFEKSKTLGSQVKESEYFNTAKNKTISDILDEGMSIEDAVNLNFGFLPDKIVESIAKQVELQMIKEGELYQVKKQKENKSSKPNIFNKYKDNIINGKEVAHNLSKMKGVGYVTKQQKLDIASLIAESNKMTGFRAAERIERANVIIDTANGGVWNNIISSAVYMKALISYSFAVNSLLSNRGASLTNGLGLVFSGDLTIKEVAKILTNKDLRDYSRSIAYDTLYRGGIGFAETTAIIDNESQKARLSEYKLGKSALILPPKILAAIGGRIASSPDSASSAKITVQNMIVYAKEAVRVDAEKNKEVIPEKVVSQRAWDMVFSKSRQEAISQAEAEFLSEGKKLVGKTHGTGFFSNSKIASATVTKSTLNNVINRNSTEFTRRVGEIIFEKIENQQAEIWADAVKNSQDKLFKADIGIDFSSYSKDDLKGQNLFVKFLSAPITGVMATATRTAAGFMKKNVYGGLDNAIFDGKKQVFSQIGSALNLLMFGFPKGAANFAEVYLDSHPLYAAAKIAALGAAKVTGNKSQESRANISRMQGEVLARAVMATVKFAALKMAVAMLRDLGVCKEGLSIVIKDNVDANSKNGNVSICGKVIPIWLTGGSQFNGLLNTWSRIEGNNDGWTDQAKSGLDYLMAYIIAEKDDVIAAGIKGQTSRSDSDYPSIWSKIFSEDYKNLSKEVVDRSAQNKFIDLSTGILNNLVMIPQTAIKQTVRYGEYWFGNSNVYYKKTFEDSNSGKWESISDRFMSGMLYNSGIGDIFQSAGLLGKPALDYRGRLINEDLKLDRYDKVLQEYDQYMGHSRNTFYTKDKAGNVDVIKSDEEYYKYFEKCTKKMNVWVKENALKFDEYYKDYKEDGGKKTKVDYIESKISSTISKINKEVRVEMGSKE